MLRLTALLLLCYCSAITASFAQSGSNAQRDTAQSGVHRQDTVKSVASLHRPDSSKRAAPLSGSASIRGKVSDTSEKKTLANATIIVLRKEDSIVVKFVRSDKAGNFTLTKLPPGKLLLLITYPSYADYVDELNLKDSSATDLPPIGLVMKSKLLQAVVISGNKSAIRMKGDTTEFVADSFHTQAGATVEDLLKKLPGIQVDRNGKITAQGETVQKVLVDGEEFFGDDPTLVTQNLRADMVDKVQVYDKKSDQAVFSGIDDGQHSKTINVKLKDGKKNGYFGKVSAGVGTDGFYDYQGMLNYFKNKRKFALFGISSNTGKTGLNWRERDNYGQSLASSVDFDDITGSFTFTGAGQNELDTWSGKYEGQGLPSVNTAGAHYNDKWDNDRESANINFKTMQLKINTLSTTNSENILPDTLYYNNQKQTSNNQIIRNTMDGSYEIKFDSTSTLKINADGGNDHKTIHNGFTSEALASDSSLVNRNTRTISSVDDNNVVNSNLLWRKKLPKKGRTISINIRENYNRDVSTGYLNSNTNFYSGGVFSRDSLIDQYKVYHTENLLFDSKIVYTEPLSKSSYLIVNYGATIANSSSDRGSFNNSGGGKYNLLDSLYSNDYRFNVLSNKGGLAYSLIKKKIRLSAGNSIGFTGFHQTDLHADTSTHRNFVNWYPMANMTYSFSNYRRLQFEYNGNTIQPTLQQIQPILTNEDPLNVTIGNPALKPQFRNQMTLYFNDFKVLSERGIWAYLQYSFTQNAISTNTRFDSTGKQTSQAVNVSGNHAWSGNMDYNIKWKGPDMRVGFNGRFNQNSNASIVNGVMNTTENGSYSVGMSLTKTKDKVFEASIYFSPTYTQSRSSINSGTTTHFWTYDITPYTNLYFPHKFQLYAECLTSLRQKTSVFDKNTDVAQVNAWFGKKFMKNDALLIKASVNDLFNQNIGFNRNVSSNFVSQNTYSTIQRYFMLSVEWNFTKAGTPAPRQ
ncbi:MAG: outer membrane beta-barrel protein [Puia sp.]|nr:outer membrane beta-barrel protein [Puia sp.]